MLKIITHNYYLMYLYCTHTLNVKSVTRKVGKPIDFYKTELPLAVITSERPAQRSRGTLCCLLKHIVFVCTCDGDEDQITFYYRLMQKTDHSKGFTHFFW